MDGKGPELTLRFDRGTILVEGIHPSNRNLVPFVQFDPRTKVDRAEGYRYRLIVEELRRKQVSYLDQARDYQPLQFDLKSARNPFPHQKEAVQAWWTANGKGLVVLPTGTGKTFTAILAMIQAARPTLVVTPTIDLLHQWHTELEASFGFPVGMLGGGEYTLSPVTVSTYDSAYIHVERWGNRFGLLIFDECHHLPGATYSMAARMSLAPFRLGLTATPERSDGQEVAYEDLIGPIIYRREITELSGQFLADYRTEQIFIRMSAEEQERFDHNKSVYRSFLSAKQLSISSPEGWRRFLFEAARTKEGWQALQAYRDMKKVERSAEGKFLQLEALLKKHTADRILIFTADNATVYDISRKYLIPALTHQTKTKERRLMLERFHSGEYSTIVTSQVLNEGVDVPAASVGIVLSGTCTVRENVQRLGRILRKRPDKQAILYELILEGTSEVYSSERRRQHNAFG
ncbi:DEAD/DEAH box helicase family protein [Telmatocola sphagniphila]|uniref:DNA 3'-5' helicase n=2 Tax=Telmatocola sphagniphila TaxID=1123043 RepID=A0A8E6BDD6_9BACT|nr:DEAD/DEAH box helicase family protein [Telmatocola sphagniphila]